MSLKIISLSASLLKYSPGYTPILIVASEDDKPVAKLLAAIRKSVCLVIEIFSRTVHLTSFVDAGWKHADTFTYGGKQLSSK